MEVSAAMVKELRERSGAAIMDCKKALIEAVGDFERAFEVLRQHGIAGASSKAARSVSEGLVCGKVADDGKSAVMVEVACETDFVARNPDFVSACNSIAEVAFKNRPASVDALLKLELNGSTVADFLSQKIAITGENMVIQRLAVMDLDTKSGAIGLYVHGLGGKMGALMKLESAGAVDAAQAGALAREIAMHAVSAKPQYISRDQVPAEIIANETRIESGKSDLADKKPEIREKIIAGRVDKIIAERCLLQQPFIKDPGKTIAQYLKEQGKAMNAELKPTQFALFILGETRTDTRNASN